MINIKELCKKYKYSEITFRTLLCRPEFNQFRLPSCSHFTFDNSDNFHKVLKFVLNLKRKKRYVILLFLLCNMQVALCQRYEPVIIYSPTGEPQTVLKGHIKYDNYGVPKSHIQTKRGMRGIR